MYEYQVLEGDDLVSEEQLNEFSKEGWRLITIAQKEQTYFFYFERMKKAS